MTYKTLKSFKIKDYKCFLNENDYQGFDEIKPINVIIGKNNSGKSKILEFLKQFVTSNSDKGNLLLSDKIYIEKYLEESELLSVFRSGHTGGTFSLLLVILEQTTYI